MEKGQKVRVIRGKYEGCDSEIDEPHSDFPNFYWCWIDRWKKRGKGGLMILAEPTRALLHEGQLEKK